MTALIVQFPAPAIVDEDLSIRCLTCDSADHFRLLYSGIVECAACNRTMPVVQWRFDVDAGEIHS